MPVSDEDCSKHLQKKMRKVWPKADAVVIVHVVALLIALDTTTAFALSFGISKFALA